MFRNSTMYRRMWYVRKRNARRISIYFRLFTIMSIFVLLVSYATNRLLPSVIKISEHRARSLMSSAIHDILRDTYGEEMQYDQLAIVSRDAEGKITSVQADIQKTNLLAARISQSIEQRLAAAGRERISIPFGALFGSSVIAGSGPPIYVSILPVGSVETVFHSEFTSQGINQTRHSISLQVKTCVGIVAPLIKKDIEIVTIVPVAETIIVGRVPEIFGESVSPAVELSGASGG